MKYEETYYYIRKYNRISEICPHCGVSAQAQQHHACSHRLENCNVEYYIMFQCLCCEKNFLKTLIFTAKKVKKGAKEEADYKYKPSSDWSDCFPVSFGADANALRDLKKHLSKNVFSDLEEALKCKAIGANNASCAMFRRALQSGLVELGADKAKKLVEQIKSLSIKLPPDLLDWANQVRIFGNWGAHNQFDVLKEVTIDEIKDAQNFISEFFKYTFVMPKTLVKAKKKTTIVKKP